ncbi:MAG TPA: T9SS type A sorting domain-containing protein, partial [Saprospiraceae bacterium]|nr:T9SS type A sorting domain-containing protein [Saprospiraceae bacterium]
AVFYFFTMYHEEAIAADPDFFNSQVNTLCQWHLLDPVDSLEWVRAAIISKYQNGRKNPFVLDCTLPYRTYCPNYLPNCDTSFTSVQDIKLALVKVFPNPAHDAISFCLPADDMHITSISVYNLNGTQVLKKEIKTGSSCAQLNSVDLNSLQKAMYIVKISANNEHGEPDYITKFIKL